MSSGQRLELLEKHPGYPIVLEIVEGLKGHQTVLAGGCVRDCLLGIAPKDLDIATSAAPEIVEKAFEHTLAVGKAFGTIVVVKGGQNFEVTTFRSDGAYLDGRHPSQVTFTNIREDAARRDFTVNALFYDPLQREVLDYVDGVRDLKSRVLRTVGIAADRFREDRLRMLRAVRFVAQLDFALDPDALKSIQAEASEISKVSVERVHNEIRRLLESKGRIGGLEILIRSGLVQFVWPEIAAVDPRQLQRFPKLNNWENAYSALTWLAGDTDPEPRLRAWKVSRESLRRVKLQLEQARALDKSSFPDRARALGGELHDDVLALAHGIHGTALTGKWIEEFESKVGRLGELPKALLSGEDLRAVGVEPGARMGDLLKRAYDAQLDGRVHDRDSALKLLKV